MARPRNTKICRVNSCGTLTYTSNFDYCNKHQKRFERHGHTDSLMEQHGMHLSAEHRTWRYMKGRCEDPHNINYPRYGALGVKVCSNLSNSFIAFYTLLGGKPDKKYSIDRIDPERNCSCGECMECISNHWSMNLRWANARLQAINKKLSKRNRSGHRGVCWDSYRKRWAASISTGKRYKMLGRFNEKEAAIRAYKAAFLEYYGYRYDTGIMQVNING